MYVHVFPRSSRLPRLYLNPFSFDFVARTLLLAVMLVLTTLFLTHAIAQPASAESADALSLPEGVETDWWGTVQEDIRQSEYHLSWQEDSHLSNMQAAYQAPNRAHNLRTYFTKEGIQMTPRSEATSAWEWELTLTGYGYDGHIEAVATAQQSVTDNRIEYQRGDLTEWYINDERGLEQGFTIQSPPLSHAAGPLVLELALTSDLTPHLTADGQAIEFTTDDGAQVLRYDNLFAFDATGRDLPAQMSLTPQNDAIRLEVDAAHAVYPIIIDPLATSPAWTAEGNQDSAQFGYSVSTAGDVNGDGYSDVIIGAPYYDAGQTDEGRAFVYYGSATGLSANADWAAEGNQASAQFGTSVGLAGDINADGYADVIVGEPNYNDGAGAGQGRVLVWYGSDAGLGDNGIPSNADWRATGDQTGTSFGFSVGTAGDVNGDGYDDIIVGAYLYDDEGRVFVWHGSDEGLGANGLPGNEDWTAESDQANAEFGYSVGTAGDVNSDGYADVIVGARYYDNGHTNEGQAYVYHGSDSGLNSTANWTAESNQAYAYFASSVGTAGDVNGDGYADIIVGAPYYDGGNTDEGRAYVYHGSSTGLSGAADWTAESNSNYASFGFSVGTAGDVNGDGYADVIVGAPYYDYSSYTDEGRVYIYHGSATGLNSSSNWTLDPTNQAYAYFGWSVSTAGDVNGDGHADIIIGAAKYDGGQPDEGQSYLYYGSAEGLRTTHNWTKTESGDFGTSVSTAGDVNGDGYADVIVGAPNFENNQPQEGRVFVYHGSATGLSTSAAWTAESNQAQAHFGHSVSSAGDVNGDGYSDIIVGAYFYDNGELNEGRAYVYYGSPSGLSGTPWTAESDQTAAWFGWSVSTAGDINGDGYADVIIGARYYENGEYREGRAYVYHGSTTGLNTTANWTAESDQAEANFGYAVGTAGDVNGDGYSDVIVGAPNYDDGQNDEGRAYVYHGSTTGLSTTANWTAESEQDSAQFGYTVGTAGDVNGDAYAEVIVGAPYYDDGQTNEGRAYVYHGHGSGVGLSTDPDWTGENNRANTNFGTSVGTAGDVNGDGYVDIIVGAPEYYTHAYYGSPTGIGSSTNLTYLGTSVSTAGDVNGDGYADVITGKSTANAAYLYYGNGGAGSLVLPRQLRSDGSTPIAQLGMSDSGTSVQLQLNGWSPLGRQKVKLHWQVAPVGSSFSDPGVINGTSSDWIDTLPTGTVIPQGVTGLTPNTAYHWRARLLYRPGNPLGQSASRWIHMPWNGGQETDFRTLAGPGGDPEADLSLTKVDTTDPVVMGDNLNYTLTINNGGPDTATNVTLTDNLPSGLTFVSATASQGSCTETGGTVTCSLGNINSAATVHVTIVATTTADGTITNTASVTSDTTDPNSANNSATEETIVTATGGADLAVALSDSPDPVAVGSTATYAIVVTNNGPAAATNVILTDNLPSEMTFTSATSDQGSCTEASGTVSCNLGDISNGESMNVTLVVTTTVEGTFTNSINVTTDEDDFNTANDATTEETLVAAADAAEVAVTLSAPDAVAVGKKLSYAIVVANKGPITATNVVLSDNLPASATFISATSDQGSCTEASSTVTCNLGYMSRDSSMNVTVVISTTVEGSLTNTVNVTANESDPIAGNNSATQESTVASSLTQLLVTQGATSAVYPGDTFTVTINITDTEQLYGAETSCVVNDPAVLQPQSGAFGNFFNPEPLIGKNFANASDGSWLGVISQKRPAEPLSGYGELATLTYKALGYGEATVTCVPHFSDRDGFKLLAVGYETIISILNLGINGQATYQGRLDHTGITVSAIVSDTGTVAEETITNNDGNMAFNNLQTGPHIFKADAASYLPSCTTVEVDGPTTLPATRILGGDVFDADGLMDVIDLIDATEIAKYYGLETPSENPRVDINNDGFVNIQDLAILAGNYELAGCQGWQAQQ